MVNYQVKCALVSNSTLSRIIDGFERVEKSTASKIVRASINDKMVTLSADPMIDDSLKNAYCVCGLVVASRVQLITVLRMSCSPGFESKIPVKSQGFS